MSNFSFEVVNYGESQVSEWLEALDPSFGSNSLLVGRRILTLSEDTFSEVFIGSVGFDVTGPCTRCQMICIDQETGEKDPNILVSLRDMRREYAQCAPNTLKINELSFGVYLSLKRNKDEKRIKVLLLSNTELRVGSPVRISYKPRDSGAQ
ncbi:MOSC domain-containing protein [Ditylenchus destructor]|nr:MOSC domain-containing protein [Ditylenchus destructor]